MKAFDICVVLCALLAIAESQAPPAMDNISKACMAETKVTEADLKAIEGKDFKESDAKDNMKCFFKCTMDKAGHMKGGKFDVDATIANLKNNPAFKDHMDDIEKVMKECKDVQGMSDCDTAFKLVMCVKDHDKD